MKPNRSLFLLLIFLIPFILNANTNETWLSSNPEKQFKNEGIDDQIGYGRVFIPVMTKTEWEPNIKIYPLYTKDQSKKVLTDLKMGQSIFLKPGYYKLVFGSATESFDKVQKSFTVKEQETTFINSDWSALLVEIIDTNREKIRFGYEIFDLSSGISKGFKYSKASDDFNDSRTTWILNPGKYKIVKQGEPFNSITNFSTFELLPGELKEFSIVIDETTKNFIGSGEIHSLKDMIKETNKWHDYLSLKGSFSLNSNNALDRENPTTDYSFKGNIDNTVKYDVFPHYTNLKQKGTTEWIKNSADDDIRVAQDELKFDNIEVYYFTKIFGIYASLNLQTKLFSKKSYFSEEHNVIKITTENDSTITGNALNVEISPSIFPSELSEGGGFYFSLIKTGLSNLYIRTGLEFVQTINNNNYEKITETTDSYIYKEMENNYIVGTVLSAGADLQITGNLSYTSEADFLYALNRTKNYNFELQNNFSYKLFKYISIDYDLNLGYNSSTDYLIWDHRLSLDFSYYLNN